MADQKLTQLTLATEAQILASALLYGVADPSGTPASVKSTIGMLLGEYYIIAPSVASNNLTLKLTHLDGTDPSATNPLLFKVGNTWQIIIDNLTFTKNAGTNWCNAGSSELAAKNVDYFVYIIQETGAAAGTKLGFSRIPYATTMADFVNTSTDKKYIAGGWTNFTSTDTVRNIGRFKAQLSATASFNWSIPSAKVINYSIFETDWLTWQPTYAASGSMTYTTVTTDLAEYRIAETTCEIELKAHGTTGGTGSNTLTATPPFTATNGGQGIPIASYVNEGSNVGGVGTVGSTTFNFSRYDNANFGLGANRYLVGLGSYRIG